MALVKCRVVHAHNTNKLVVDFLLEEVLVLSGLNIFCFVACHHCMPQDVHCVDEAVVLAVQNGIFS